jgi:hypothetical protein
MSTRGRKRELKATYKAQERAALEAAMPISKSDVHDLFAQLDSSGFTCDHTLRETNQFLRSRNIDPSAVIPWLHQYGGFCDCEVLANVADQYCSIVGYEV